MNYSLKFPDDGPLFEEDGIGPVTWTGAHVSKAERVKLLKLSNSYQPLRKRKKNAIVSEKTPVKKQKKLSSETNDDSDDSEVNDGSDGSKSSDSSDESSSSEDEDDGANIGIIVIFSYNLFSFISHRYFFDQIYLYCTVCRCNLHLHRCF